MILILTGAVIFSNCFRLLISRDGVYYQRLWLKSALETAIEIPSTAWWLSYQQRVIKSITHLLSVTLYTMLLHVAHSEGSVRRFVAQGCSDFGYAEVDKVCPNCSLNDELINERGGCESWARCLWVFDVVWLMFLETSNDTQCTVMGELWREELEEWQDKANDEICPPFWQHLCYEMFKPNWS